VHDDGKRSPDFDRFKFYLKKGALTSCAAPVAHPFTVARSAQIVPHGPLHRLMMPSAASDKPDLVAGRDAIHAAMRTNGHHSTGRRAALPPVPIFRDAVRSHVMHDMAPKPTRTSSPMARERPSPLSPNNHRKARIRVLTAAQIMMKRVARVLCPSRHRRKFSMKPDGLRIGSVFSCVARSTKDTRIGL